MPSLDAYEANLQQRLRELREGDVAYELHRWVIVNAIVFSIDLHRDATPQRVLDCGCGLGFMTKELAEFWQVAGIDVSERSIELAKEEHPLVEFHAMSASDFAEYMKVMSIPPFHHAVLNMVLHSVDDQTVKEILDGVRKCLSPEGSVIVVVPDQEWLAQKLHENAVGNGMEGDALRSWVLAQIENPIVTLPVKIKDGSYYPEPITIYNRSLEDYGNLLMESDFGVPWEQRSGETGELISSTIIPYLDMDDYTPSMELMERNRSLLMSFAI